MLVLFSIIYFLKMLLKKNIKNVQNVFHNMSSVYIQAARGPMFLFITLYKSINV